MFEAVRTRLRKRTWPVAVVALAAACGRSDEVGWAGREMPDSMRSQAASSEQVATSSAAGSDEGVLGEYRALARSLAPVQGEAMQSEDLATLWAQLAADVDAEIVMKSKFHQRLVERKSEIEALVEEAERSGEPMPDEQRAELARHYRNIQVEFARKRNEELRKPPYVDRLKRFQAAVFERMRELAPDRVAEINRLEELEGRLFIPDTAAPVPGMRTTGPLLPPGAIERSLEEARSRPPER